jgi:hypothetical protein
MANAVRPGRQDLTPQQQGIPLKQTQHMQPEFMQAQMQSQQAWIMSQQALSPLVQVMHTPSLVSAHSHLHMAMLQQQIIVPFIMQHRLHMPPAAILHRFCKVAAATSSSQTHVTFMPPAHFSIFILQRGTIIMPGAAAAIPAIWPIIGIAPAIPRAALMPRSIITLDIPYPFVQAVEWGSRRRTRT